MTDNVFASYDLISDLAANLPANPNPANGRLAVFQATDTGAMYAWNGSAWRLIPPASASANLVYAGPTSGSAAAPSFRATVPGDLPASASSFYWDNTNKYLGIGTVPDTALVVSSGGIRVTGTIGAGTGHFRTDSGLEVSGPSDALMSLFLETNPGTTVNEAALAYGAYDAGGTLAKTASISSKWASPTGGSAYGVLRLNATYNSGANDSIGIRIFGNQGVSIFGTSDTVGPGTNICSINGVCSANNIGIGTVAPSRLLSLVSATSDAMIGLDRGGTTNLGALEFKTAGVQDWFFGTRDVGNSDFHLYSVGTNTDVIRVLKSNGYVGIGQNVNPGVPLDVYASSSAIIRLGTSSTTDNANFQVNNDTGLGFVCFAWSSAAGGTRYNNSRNNMGLMECQSAGPFVVGTNSSQPLVFGTALTERMRITPGGLVGIGTQTPHSALAVVGLPVYANNAAAIAGGLAAGDFYRTGGDPDLVCVVH